MSDEVELKPCPFCGGEPSEWYFHDYNTDRGYDMFGCQSCNFACDYGRDSDSEKIWNTRPPSAETVAGVKVKPLEWRGPFPANGYKRGRWEAGAFSIVRNGAEYWRVYFNRMDEKDAIYTTPEDAKAAAQADYERRILSAIEPRTPGVESMKDAIENAIWDVCDEGTFEYGLNSEGIVEQMANNVVAALRTLTGDKP